MNESYLGKHPVIHPRAFVHSRAVIIGEVKIGAESTIWPNATLRGDDGRIEIGAQTSIQDVSVIHTTEDLSTVTIGDRTTVGHNSTIHGASVGSDCLIGMGSILLDNAKIGDWSLVGAGTLITQGVVIPPRSLVLGSPGRVVREISEKEVEWITTSWKRYVKQCQIYRDAMETSFG